jgi:hypothetical protein
MKTFPALSVSSKTASIYTSPDHKSRVRLRVTCDFGLWHRRGEERRGAPPGGEERSTVWRRAQSRRSSASWRRRDAILHGAKLSFCSRLCRLLTRKIFLDTLIPLILVDSLPSFHKVLEIVGTDRATVWISAVVSCSRGQIRLFHVFVSVCFHIESSVCLPLSGFSSGVWVMYAAVTDCKHNLLLEAFLWSIFYWCWSSCNYVQFGVNRSERLVVLTCMYLYCLYAYVMRFSRWG